MFDSQKELAVALSRLKVLQDPKVKAEQYQTSSEIAAEILWNAKMKGDIENKVIADFGAGNGIFGIGASLLGAKGIYFIENEKDALKILKWNVEFTNKDIAPLPNTRVLNSDVRRFEIPCEVVIQNPPFGTKEKHADQIFLRAAFATAPIVYSFHKESTLSYVKRYSNEMNYEVTDLFRIDFPIKKTQKFHKKPKVDVKTVCVRMKKLPLE